jgi:hypothetical protein
MLFRISHLQPVLFFCLLMGSFSSGYAQVQLEGIVADKKTGEPIPFVHLVVKNKLTGTASNADGIFRLDVSGLSDTDSLKITHLNYSPLTLAVRDVGKDAKIFLTEQVTVLSEITVKATDDYAVMEEMIQRTKESTGIPFTASYYYRELVREDSSYNKFADGILTTTYEPKDELSIRVDQSRAYELQKEEGLELDLASPIKVENVLSYAFVNFLNRFREKSRKNYLFYFQEGETPEDYHTLFIEPRKDVKRGSNELYFSAVIKTDQNKHLREMEIALDTTGISARGAFGVSVEILSGKITLSFVNLEAKNYLSFVRFDFTTRIRHTRLENYVTEVLLLSARPGIEAIARKDEFTKSSLYKAGTHFTSEFWRGINIPLLTTEETKLLQELESRGIPVKVK